MLLQSQPQGPAPNRSIQSSMVTMKRKRSSSPSPAIAASGAVLTPPLSVEEEPSSTCLLTRAVHVLSTAATALSQVTFLYQSDPTAREGLLQAVECIQSVVDAGGKLIVCGVGKSGLVGRKTVASLKSLGIACSFLHPVEALHGDLGDVRENDAVLFISYSGKTAELLSVLSHIPSTVPILAITSQTRPLDCALLRPRLSAASSTSPPTAILLPAPIPEKEETSFGVSAPTTSTTVTIAVGDMLALTLAEALYGGKARTKDVFARNHPGGAIGEVERGRRKGMEGEDGEDDDAAGLTMEEEDVAGGNSDEGLDEDMVSDAPARDDRAKRRKKEGQFASPACSD